MQLSDMARSVEPENHIRAQYVFHGGALKSPFSTGADEVLLALTRQRRLSQSGLPSKFRPLVAWARRVPLLRGALGTATNESHSKQVIAVIGLSDIRPPFIYPRFSRDCLVIATASCDAQVAAVSQVPHPAMQKAQNASTHKNSAKQMLRFALASPFKPPLRLQLAIQSRGISSLPTSQWWSLRRDTRGLPRWNRLLFSAHGDWLGLLRNSGKSSSATARLLAWSGRWWTRTW